MIDRLRDLGVLPDKDRGDKFYPPPKDIRKALEESPYKDEIIDYVLSHEGDVKRDLLRWPRSRGGIMTDIGILRHMLVGNIVIEPFNIKHLQSNGYEVTVSNVYFRKRTAQELKDEGADYPVFHDVMVYDPYSPESIQLMWAGPVDPVKGSDIQQSIYMGLKGGVMVAQRYQKLNTFHHLEPEDEVILLNPNEMILARTREKIGGKNVMSTFIAGKSTPARHGFEICSDSFLGDVGFIYYWALEIVNKHPDVALCLVAGTRVATMIFMEHNEPPLATYKEGTFYQGQGDENGSIRKIVPKTLKTK